MRGVSLCTGSGGLDLGLEQLGVEVVAQAELDPACCEILERHWPDVENFGDLRAIDWEAVRDALGTIDFVFAGFPCQPVSHAGARRGTDDPRWLLPEVLRCLRVLRPRYVLLENVPGLVTSGLVGDVVGGLAALGYRWAYDRLSAADVGAPHKRDRWWCVAVLDGAAPVAGVFGIDADGRVPRGGQDEPRRSAFAAVLAGTKVAHAAYAVADRAGADADTDGDAVADAEHARPSRAGSESQSGGAVVVALNDRAEEGAAPPDPGGVEREGRSVGEGESSGARSGADGEDTVAWGIYAGAIDRWERSIGRPAPGPTDDRGRLNPDFVEWMLGYPAGWTAGVSRTQRLKMLGNSVQVQCASVVGVWLGEFAAREERAAA